MDWAKGLTGAGVLTAGTSMRSSLVTNSRLSDFEFGSDPAHLRLDALWRAYYASTQQGDIAQRDSRFQQFVDDFVTTYSSWHPERDVGPAAPANSLAAAKGHPVLVIGGIACNFKTSVHVACRALDQPLSSSAPLLPWRGLLRLLVILSRSHHNRLVRFGTP
jgi:hypothetical protein